MQPAFFQTRTQVYIMNCKTIIL